MQFMYRPASIAPTDLDVAYTAGIVDGEGCIAITRDFIRDRYFYNTVIVVANTNRAVLQWLQDRWGGHIPAPTIQHGANHRPYQQWRSLSGRSVRGMLDSIRPYLQIKRAQAENALEFIETLGSRGAKLTPLQLAEQEHLYWVQRELNHRGTAPFERKPGTNAKKPQAVADMRRRISSGETSSTWVVRTHR